MSCDASILKEIDHLKDLTDAERAALAQRIDLDSYPAGHTIFEFGDPGHALYIVRKGEVEIYVKNDRGEKIVLEVAKPGTVFGEVSLLDNGSRTAWVGAITHCEVLRLDREHFEDYLREFTPAALNLLSVVARRLRKSDEVIRRTVTRNANDVIAEERNLLTRILEFVPAVAGSLPAVVLHAALIVTWVTINLGIVRRIKVFDPAPFYLLADIFTIEAILLTLFVLASQNRQRARDRVMSDISFESSLSSELKIAHLHEKIDRLAESTYEAVINTQKLMALQAAKEEED